MTKINIDYEKIIIASLVMIKSHYDTFLSIGMRPDMFSTAYKGLFELLDEGVNASTKRDVTGVWVDRLYVESEGEFLAMCQKHVDIKKDEWLISQGDKMRSSESPQETFAEITKEYDELWSISARPKSIYEEAYEFTVGDTAKDSLILYEHDGLNKKGGRFKGDLEVIGARPGMGKTTFILKDILYLLKLGKKVLFNSMDMSGRDIVIGLSAIINGITIKDVRIAIIKKRKGEANQEDLDLLKKIGETIKDVEMFDLEVVYMTDPFMFIKKIGQSGADQVYIDYISLFEGGSESRTLEPITSGLKKACVMYNVSMIALSQLSRENERRGGSKRPQLIDLRNGGSVEQDADIVRFLYRPSYYGIEQDADGNTVDESGLEYSKMIEIITLKNRNGSLGVDKAYFYAGILKYNTETHLQVAGEPTNIRISEPIEDIGDVPF